MGYIYEINVNVTMFSSTLTNLIKERDTEKVNGWCVVGTETHPSLLQAIIVIRYRQHVIQTCLGF